MNTYEKIWEEYLEDNYFPTNIRSIKTIEFSEFKELVFNDYGKTKELILSMLAGDIIILKNAISKSVVKEIKDGLYEYGNTTPESDYKTTKAIPNFHIKSKYRDTSKDRGTRGYKVVDGYDEVGHSYYFYRWNEDNLNIFSNIEELWNTVKVFNGLDINQYKKNLPEDKIIDQIQAIHYTANEGEITSHCDMSRWQKTNLTVSLTKKGEDFNVGGQYFLDKNENKVYSEDLIEVGDAPLFIATTFHGVESPDYKGRWQLLATAIQSQCVENRTISHSLTNFKKNPKKIMESYKKNEFRV
jgi:hypothetical protein|tara:strand:+ start:14185 stop:15081 length:897 start_codon:yes stop_codon:yes gene_type:complete